MGLVLWDMSATLLACEFDSTDAYKIIRADDINVYTHDIPSKRDPDGNPAFGSVEKHEALDDGKARITAPNKMVKPYLGELAIVEVAKKIPERPS